MLSPQQSQLPQLGTKNRKLGNREAAFPFGNRLRQSLGGSSTYWHHNDLNQIDREGGAGTTLVEGNVDEPAIVEVDVNSDGYQRAAVLSNPGGGNFLFRREVEVDEGLNTIDVRAEDASGNISPIKNYELTLPSVAKTYEYDLNGNLRFERDYLGAVLREFRWDAQNRLTHVIQGTNETEFEYDGLDRRIRMIERVSGVEQSNEVYLWVDGEIVQKRNSTADTVLSDYYWFGFSEGVNDYFYSRDHLGSVREVVASDGTALESRYEYDLWGNVTRIAGTGVESDFLYTGHIYHKGSDLHLAQYRAYDSELGRWLSRDPARFIDGPNLYAYVDNNPINLVDPLGLWTFSFRLNLTLGVVDLSLDFSFDDDGSTSLTGTFGRGGSPGLGVTGGISVTNADTICSLEGSSLEAGVTIGKGIVGEINGIQSVPDSVTGEITESYQGIDIGIGFGIGLPVAPQVFYQDTNRI